MDWTLLRQIWIGSALFVNFLGHGMVLSYSACLLPGLRADDSTIRVDLDTASWLASVLGPTLIVGFIVAAGVMERFGRRWVFAGATVLKLIAWQFIYWAEDVSALMLGRVLGGLACGVMYGCGCCYIAEYASPELRGLFLNIKTVTLMLGFLVLHVVGQFFCWRTVALISSLPFVISLLINFTWPESPSWLLSKNRFEECEETFYWLRGRSDKAVRELEAMVRAQKLRMSQTLIKVTLREKIVNFLKKFKQTNFLKPVAIIVCCGLLMEASGKHVFPAYAIDILNEIFEDKSNTFYYVIAVDIISVIGCAISCVLVHMIGRRTLLFFSGVSSTILLLIISLLTFLISRGVASVSPWIVPSLVFAYFIFANLGCTVMPFVLYSEIFPLSHRETGVGLGGCIYSFVYFVCMKLLPYSLAYLRIHGTFAVFALAMVVSLVYLYFALPETRNKTLQEIEEYFEHGRFLTGDSGCGAADRETNRMLLTNKNLQDKI